MTTQRRALGRGSAGLTVSAVGLGTSDAYGGQYGESWVTFVRRALDEGVTMIDTADVYGPGTAERALGRAVAGRRDDVTIATKFGYVRHDNGEWAGVNATPAYVRHACDASLARLGVDHIDLYYLHRADPAVPVEETWGALRDLVIEGKVRCLGLSEVGPDVIRRAHAVHPVTAVQSEYSLWRRDDIEDRVLPAARALGVGFVAYAPLGRGFLTGAVTSHRDLAPADVRRVYPRFVGDRLSANLRLLEGFQGLARRWGLPPARLALAWVLAQGQDIVPIVGTRRIGHLLDDLAALSIELSADRLREIERAFPAGAAVGLRYPEGRMPDV